MNWQPIETAPKSLNVLLFYKNELGKGRTVIGHYFPPETLDCEESESGFADEGWYEFAWSQELLNLVEAEPTHWMPLPKGPK